MNLLNVINRTTRLLSALTRFAGSGATQVLTDAATIAYDVDLGINASVTLAGNRTLANPTNLRAGMRGSVVVTQDATGNRTLAYGSKWLFPGNSHVLTTTPGLFTTPPNGVGSMFSICTAPVRSFSRSKRAPRRGVIRPPLKLA